MPQQSPDKSFKEAFLRLGYDELSDLAKWNKADVNCIFRASGGIVHVACLSAQPKYRSYAVLLSALDRHAIAIARKLLPLTYKYYRPVLVGRGLNFFDIASWF